MRHLKEEFLLKPEIAYLNHGSFGATPAAVFQEYQRWQRELELEPTEFLGRRFAGLMQSAREALGAFLGVAAQDLVYVENITVAVNIVARSLDLGPNDEVLTTNHEYGACDRTWRYLSKRHGFTYVQRPVPLPLASREQVVDDFMQGVSPRTRVIFMSHITSPTAILFPVEEVCRRAREAGILTVVDGAHAPGQVSLALMAVGADFYGGNLHKWLCAPKGAGFLYARREVQPLLEPLVVSWGYEAEKPSGSEFIDHFEWLGTRDIAAFLSVPAAIDFQSQHEWPAVRRECHEILGQGLREAAEVTGMGIYYPDDSWYVQMASVPLPRAIDVAELQSRLYAEHRVEVPVHAWNDWKLLRISLQGYNERKDIGRLLEGLGALLC